MNPNTFTAPMTTIPTTARMIADVDVRSDGMSVSLTPNEPSTSVQPPALNRTEDVNGSGLA
jgi:hypothetical protein